MKTDVCSGLTTSSVLCETRSFSRHLHHLDVSSSHAMPVPNKTSTRLIPVPFVTCSQQHVTHQMLACDLESSCWTVESQEVIYTPICGMPHGLIPQPYFTCGATDRSVPYSLLCDFRDDCSDKSDEEFCVHTPCEEHTFSCGQGQCVEFSQICDGHKNCMSGSDEASCRRVNIDDYDVPPPAVINFDRPGGFRKTRMSDKNVQCPDTHFRCFTGGYCLPVYVRCNGIYDCSDHEDEMRCNVLKCLGFYRCRGIQRTICLHVNHLCDGQPQCPQHDDEVMCDLKCPQACTCYGLAFTCINTFHFSSFSQLRYLEARGSNVQQSDIRTLIMLIHLGAQACDWRNLTRFSLPNLHSLDVSDNALQYVNLTHLAGLQHLQRLSLANNPLSSRLFSNQENHQLLALMVFNFSRIQMTSLDMNNLSTVMPHLQFLDLTSSEVTSLQGKDVFKQLTSLDLRGCPVSDFNAKLMKNMSKLTHVFTDNFKLCCPLVLPQGFRGECIAPSDSISSCEDLLKSNMYRSALVLFAVLAILGNLSSIVYRSCVSPEGLKTGFTVFILHLCVSDLLMGVYLALIGVADQMFAGTYIWHEATWKQSTACSLAGFLSFLSSEVSAFLVCFITLDRFLVLHFPFSQMRFGSVSANVTCVFTWASGLIIAGIPLLPVTSHWEFYHQTGICIPLPITKTEFAGHVYCFSIMTVCNLVLFLLIAVGQSLIYYSVKVSAKSLSAWSHESTTKEGRSVKSKDAVLARRLLSIAASDFLCWFPIGLCGLLSAMDVIISSEVNVALAIIVLPLNSSLNPFLYTVNIILEKRQKARELRLRQFLQSQMKNFVTV